MKRLGVNIDHIATLRNARGEKHPNPVFAAKEVIKFGADSVTIHLREDRRHINDLDTKVICSLNKVLVNLEVSMNNEIIKKALRYKPNYICIVPENRKEITTEGGLNLKNKRIFLINLIKKLKKNKFRVSLFIEPSIKDIKDSQKLNADCVEIHTGKLCNLINENKNYNNELQKIKKATILGNKLGLEVHAGHGLTYKSAKILRRISGIKEFNIGHFIIGESIFVGLAKTIKNFRRILR